MTADQLLQRTSEGALLVIFVAVAIRAFRFPRRANVLAALFFGVIALIMVVSWVGAATDRELPRAFSIMTAVLLVALPYIVLRLAHEFARVPSVLLRLAELGFAVSVVLLLVSGDPLPGAAVLAIVGYFVLVTSYVSWRFLSGAWRSTGVVRRRMFAVAAGNGFLAFILLLAGVAAVFPEDLEGLRTGIARVATVGLGIAYFIGFAPPRLLERAWQAPDIERFLMTNASLEPGTLEDDVRVLQEATERVMGLRSAILLLDDEGRLYSPLFSPAPDEPVTQNTESLIVTRALRTQTALFVENTEETDPENADSYRYFEARAVLAAPISSGDQQFGVLTAFGDRPSLFVEDHVRLLQVLANQIAVTLRDHELMRERTRLEAQDHVVRLKDEFLSAAAHDLKTPLTTLVGQTQLMQRRALRNPEAPVDTGGLHRLLDEAQRMRVLVEDLLDASRVEQDGFLGALSPVDLAALARDVAANVGTPRHPIEVDGDAIMAVVDGARMRQVLFNLLDNAVKHSPGGGDIEVRITEYDGDVHIAVADHGVGIPQGDHEVIFERFRRGSGLADGRSGGLGLGLYICKRIVEEHGGRISVSSRRGAGSEFSIVLPAAASTPSVTEAELHESANPGS